MTDPNGGTISYEYDGNGNRIAMTDENNNLLTTYNYDALDRMILTQQPEGISMSSTYDEKNLINAIDPQ